MLIIPRSINSLRRMLRAFIVLLWRTIWVNPVRRWFLITSNFWWMLYSFLMSISITISIRRFSNNISLTTIPISLISVGLSDYISLITIRFSNYISLLGMILFLGRRISNIFTIFFRSFSHYSSTWSDIILIFHYFFGGSCISWNSVFLSFYNSFRLLRSVYFISDFLFLQVMILIFPWRSLAFY